MADIPKSEIKKEIAAILKDADLDKTSSKKVRQQLEEKLKCDLSSRKKEIDDLVMEYVESQQEEEEEDKSEQSEEEKKPARKPAPAKKRKESEDEDEESEEEESEEEKPKKRAPPKKPAAKKKKAASDSEEESEASESGSDDDYRPSKGSKKKGKKGKAAKKKKGSDSDEGSDEDWKASKSKKSGGAKKGGGGGGRGYARPLKLSPELSELVGEESAPRHEVVKRVWALIKERNLYDPKNKQFAICDDQFYKVFGVKRFRTFGMMKLLKDHFITE